MLSFVLRPSFTRRRLAALAACTGLLAAAAISHAAEPAPTAAASAAASAAPFAAPATPAAPLVHTTFVNRQAPGFQRLRLGSITVTALFDGVTHLPISLLQGITARQAESTLLGMFVPQTPEGVQTAVNAYLIDWSGRRILIDTGAAHCLGPGLGGVVDNLRLAGVDPASVQTVLLTHLHPDHVCGLTNREGHPVFPRAEVVIPQREAAHWLDARQAAQAPAAARESFQMAQKAVAPYQAAGRLRTFAEGSAPLPGVRAVSAPGHTPGHTGYLFASQGTQLLVWGDVIHSHAVQFRYPDVSISFDSDARQAIASRRTLLSRAVREKLWVAGAHLPFPGIGHVRIQGGQYQWLPAEFLPYGK